MNAVTAELNRIFFELFPDSDLPVYTNYSGYKHSRLAAHANFVLRLTGSAGEIFVKLARSNSRYARHALQVESQILDRFSRQGISLVPRIRRKTLLAGQPVLWIEPVYAPCVYEYVAQDPDHDIGDDFDNLTRSLIQLFPKAKKPGLAQDDLESRWWQKVYRHFRVPPRTGIDMGIPRVGSHGDLNLGNVMLGPDRQMTIIDWEDYECNTLAGWDFCYWTMLYTWIALETYPDSYRKWHPTPAQKAKIAEQLRSAIVRNVARICEHYQLTDAQWDHTVQLFFLYLTVKELHPKRFDKARSVRWLNLWPLAKTGGLLAIVDSLAKD